MTNQASIKYISSLLSRPDTITDGDHNSIALFRQSFPYFVPARYILTAEKHRKSGYEQATLSEIYPYMGNWVLLCNYLDASKAGAGQQHRLPDVLPAVASESRVTDKKNLDQRGIPGPNGNDRKKAPGFVQGGNSNQPKQVSQANPAAKADPQIRPNMPKRVTEPEPTPVMPEIKLEVLPPVPPPALPEEIATPVQELPVAYVPEIQVSESLSAVEEQVTQLSEVLPNTTVATPEESIIQTSQSEEVTTFPLYNIQEPSVQAMPEMDAEVHAPVLEHAEALLNTVSANAAPYIETVQEEPVTVADVLTDVVPVPVLPEVQAEIQEEAGNATADLGLVPQPVALDVQEIAFIPVATEEAVSAVEIPVMKAEAYQEPGYNVADGFKIAPTPVEMEAVAEPQRTVEAEDAEQVAAVSEPEQTPTAAESPYADNEEETAQSPLTPVRVVIDEAEIADKTDVAEVNDITGNVPVNDIAEHNNAGNTETEESIQPEVQAPVEPDNADAIASEPQMVAAPGDEYEEPTEAENLIPPVYTEDYFLQQGVKISMDMPAEIDDIKDTADEDEEEKALMVMMSFSEWLLHFKNTTEKHKEEKKDQKALKTMWQKEKLAAAMEEENEEIPENVFKMAVNSITKEDGLASETLADVYIKQGKYDKAIEMYRKLSLRNPKKNAYFARRIEEVLKEKQS